MRLSEMPDFLPAGKPGSRTRRACALGTFNDRTANSIALTALTRSAYARLTPLTRVEAALTAGQPEAAREALARFTHPASYENQHTATGAAVLRIADV